MLLVAGWEEDVEDDTAEDANTVATAVAAPGVGAVELDVGAAPAPFAAEVKPLTAPGTTLYLV